MIPKTSGELFCVQAMFSNSAKTQVFECHASFRVYL